MNAEKELGKKIKQLRKSMGYTQEQLAELVDIDDKHLSKSENGVHLPTYKTIKKLSEVLQFNLQDMDTVSSKEHLINQSPVYYKAMKILNSAKSEKELRNYYHTLKLAYRLMYDCGK